MFEKGAGGVRATLYHFAHFAPRSNDALSLDAAYAGVLRLTAGAPLAPLVAPAYAPDTAPPTPRPTALAPLHTAPAALRM